MREQREKRGEAREKGKNYVTGHSITVCTYSSFLLPFFLFPMSFQSRILHWTGCNNRKHFGQTEKKLKGRSKWVATN